MLVFATCHAMACTAFHRSRLGGRLAGGAGGALTQLFRLQNQLFRLQNQGVTAVLAAFKNQSSIIGVREIRSFPLPYSFPLPFVVCDLSLARPLGAPPCWQFPITAGVLADAGFWMVLYACL